MKIVVIIPSRTAPFRLRETLLVAQRLQSGRHEVRYVVGVDDDDRQTIEMCIMMRVRSPDFSYRVLKRMASLGQMTNIIARDNPGDVYCSLGQDLHIETQDWDEAIHRVWLANPDCVYWWRGCECPIVSHQWYRAAGYIYTDYFPFWWDDNWLIQVSGMAMKRQIFIDAHLEDRPLGTLRMRDLRFWTDFYTFMKPERRREAERIAGRLGWGPPMLDAIGDVHENFWHLIKEIEEGQGEKGPPTPEYLKAKERAERLMVA